MRCIAANGGDIVAGLDDGDVLWKSAPRQNWQTVASNPNATVWDVAIDPADPAVAYYVRASNGSAILRTTDRGASWQLIDAPTGSAQAVAVSPSDRSLLIGASGNYYASSDSGATWTSPNSPGDNRKIFLFPGTSSIVMGTDQGLLRTDDQGETWLGLTGPISSSLLYSVAVNGNTILASSQDFPPIVSFDGGKTWREVDVGGEGGGVAINPGDPRFCYSFTIYNLNVSQDGCVTFSGVPGPVWQSYVDGPNQNLITIDPHNPATIYLAAFDGVWSSSDWGLTFERLGWPAQKVTQIVLDPSDPQAVYLCSLAGMYQSLDGGASWKKLALPSSHYPYSAAVSPRDSDVILVALNGGAGRSSGGVLRSTDRGLSFHFVNQGLSTTVYNIGNDQQSIAFNPSAPDLTTPVVALATTGGVYASGDLGDTWHDIRSDAVPRLFYFVHWDQGYLWTATYGQGVLRSDRPLTSDSFVSNLAVTGGPLWFTNTIGVSVPTGSRTLDVTTLGAAQNFSVTTSLGSNTACGNWLAVSPVSGTTAGTSTGTPVTVSYTATGLPAYSNATCSGSVTVTTAGPNGSSVVIPVTLVISPQPGYCSTPVLKSAGALFSSNGGAGSVLFTLRTGCAWAASSSRSWLSITSATSGTGNGTIGYSVAAYSGPTRTAALTIGGALFSVTQTAGTAYYLTTIAGGPFPATAARGTSVAIPNLWGIAVDSAGNVYFTSSSQPVAFKLDDGGTLTRVAGTGSPGFSGDGGAGTSSQLSGNPQGVAVDGAGNLYIADCGNHRIRRVAPNGKITTVAGTGSPGFSGDGGPATAAQLNYPHGVKADAFGNLYIADTNNQRVRKMDPNGIITTVAGSGTPGFSGDGTPATSAQLNSPYDVATDTPGNLYIADQGNYRIRRVGQDGRIATLAGTGSCCYSGDGGPAASAQLNTPFAVAADNSGNVYIADSNNSRVRRVAPNGTITTVVGNGDFNFYGDAGLATNAALNRPTGVALDGSGNLYVADSGNHRVRKVGANQVISTLAGGGTGDGGPASFAGLNSPGATAKDSAGNIYVADSWYHRIRKIAPNGLISTVAGTGIAGFSGDAGPATAAALNFPRGVAVDTNGNLYLADASNNRVRKIATNGIITTVAGGGCCSLGDGGPATSGELSNPTSVAVDVSGNIYIADTSHERVRLVSTSGTITTLAGTGSSGYSGDGGPATSAQLNNPCGVAVEPSGGLYIADNNNQRIRFVAGPGTIATVAGTGAAGFSGDGGPASSAQLNYPLGVAVAASGGLYIADTNNQRIRFVAGSGIIATVAGTGAAGFSGDDGPALSAQLNNPQGVAVDSSGNLLIADWNNNAVRLLAPAGAQPLLTITGEHAGNFTTGQAATYVVTVGNAVSTGPTSGMVTVTEWPPSSFTQVSMSGAGWSCNDTTCTRSDTLPSGASYPPITVTANVSAAAPSQVTNLVSVSGGGSAAAGAMDLTTILNPPAAPVLVAPANGATAVLLGPTLTWTAAAGARSYDVYFGTLSTPPLVTSTTGTSYTPATLSLDTTYYWQIVAQNDSASSNSATWSFTTGAALAPLQFVPVTPCRVVDTRVPAGQFGGPTMTAASTRSFPIPQGGCNIPATAQAYSVNVTVVPEGPLGFLSLWPTGQPQPVASTLNSWGGIVVANAAIVPAGTGGAVSVYASDETDVILDVNGYFASAGTVSPSAFYAAPPCRIADTRGPTGQFGGPSLYAGQTRGFPIPSSLCQTPAGATAYSLNVTAVPDTNYLGFLSTWPTGQAQPNVSTLNSWTGKAVANAALVPAGSNGSISAFVTNPTDVILDINGYFGQPGGAGALSFYPVTPCRVADTRWPAGPFGGPEMTAVSTRSFAIPASGCYVPSTAAAYSVNITVVPDARLSFLSAWPAGLAQPVVSTLNSWDGSVVANAAVVPAGANGAISIFVTDPTQVILDINGYFAP